MLVRPLLAGRLLVRILFCVSAAAFTVVLVASGVLGVAMVRDVIPQLGAVGIGDLQLGHLLGVSWTANTALVAGVGTAIAALVIVRRSPAH
ncbi:hypothetical protein ELQ90_09600 [Labedella phragmitis]|uniref:Uncharacterized protein n=1 Tax=Labedella phragmitis TaxID=2498849 RepID=A0A3S4BIP6_9MICO|nr:hypothetical protein [Labedella phragmitis]RWZ51041.1 hypothetical protein ELQ90_09600 [Labedella phragmitis]